MEREEGDGEGVREGLREDGREVEDDGLGWCLAQARNFFMHWWGLVEWKSVELWPYLPHLKHLLKDLIRSF